MSIVNYNEFRVSQVDENNIVLLDEHKINAVADFMQSNEFSFLSLKTDNIDKSSFDLLMRYQFIDKLIIRVDDEKFDFSFLSHLNHLKELRINGSHKHIIDFSTLIELERLTIDWKKGYESIFNLPKLKELNLTGYKGKDLIDFSKLEKLERLILNKGAITSFKGLEMLTKLRVLKAFYLRNLNNVGFLPSSVECLDLTNCPKITNLLGVEKLVKLEELWIENCKDIESLKLIEKLIHLDRIDLMGNTKIIDGDMKPLVGKKEVRFIEYKHYSHKEDEI